MDWAQVGGACGAIISLTKEAFAPVEIPHCWGRRVSVSNIAVEGAGNHRVVPQRSEFAQEVRT